MQGGQEVVSGTIWPPSRLLPDSGGGPSPTGCIQNKRLKQVSGLFEKEVLRPGDASEANKKRNMISCWSEAVPSIVQGFRRRGACR